MEKAVVMFKKQQKLSSTSEGNRHLRKLMNLRYKVPNKLIRLREDRHTRAWNEQSVANVAQRMQLAQKSGGFFSDEAVFQHNLSRLLEGLDRVKTLYPNSDLSAMAAVRRSRRSAALPLGRALLTAISSPTIMFITV
ncbi:hypothetical protein SGGMMB4_02473 [Sodalis glossinidius str. 'morsitans']|uniref:Uncharacterized protein n=1 Tax=Sodalis glossinidius (strain morsitans) TaxID=343509 RepID=A0A193QIS5_SODGM|nr:hypothetical protein [Sodalis glossinidius]CRL45008.1 hypothetical protein SGGMMB4_02473 [Sodalis glossinidius str. 'morsitans']